VTAEIYGEPVAQDFEHAFRGELVCRERSDFQKIEVFEHAHFGKMLLLDDVVQTTERDEFCYHEMLVHPALLSRPRIERALVIGGGDGGTLRRLLDHAEAAVMCEIDERVTATAREHLAAIWDGAFDDPRARVLYEDGATYVARHEDAFDAIVVDSTDPVGPAVVLFSEAFYSSCRRALRPSGVLVAQTGSPMYQTAELQRAVSNMARVFPTVETYTGFVPTYPGVLWSFTVGTDGAPVSQASPEDIRARMRQRGIATSFYSPDIHAAAFALPAFVRRIVDEARATAQPAAVPQR
jgi:spermidine synthase